MNNHLQYVAAFLNILSLWQDDDRKCTRLYINICTTLHTMQLIHKITSSVQSYSLGEKS